MEAKGAVTGELVGMEATGGALEGRAAPADLAETAREKEGAEETTEEPVVEEGTLVAVEYLEGRAGGMDQPGLHRCTSKYACIGTRSLRSVSACSKSSLQIRRTRLARWCTHSTSATRYQHRSLSKTQSPCSSRKAHTGARSVRCIRSPST